VWQDMVSVSKLRAGASGLIKVDAALTLALRTQKAVREKNLDTLLAQARAENPLKEPPTLSDAQRTAASS
jgi:hypothetical protein